MARLLAESVDCPYCCKPLAEAGAHIDHIVPIALGGLHSISNLAACCSACNVRKRDMPLDDWLGRLTILGRASALRMLEVKGVALGPGSAKPIAGGKGAERF